MRVLIFGSRSLTWKHYDVMRHVATHATLAENVPYAAFVKRWTTPTNKLTAEEQAHVHRWLPEDTVITLLNGDGPPGKERGAIGADKLAVFACMQGWWKYEKRRMRWFPPEPQGDETWAQAAGRRNRGMVETKPERVYCVHTDLDSSKGSSMTASLLKAAGIPFWYIRVTPAGAVVSVEER